MENYQISEVQADDLIMEIREMQDEKKRFESIAIQQIQAIEDRLEVKNQLLEDAIQFSKDQLRAFFLTVDKKQTKTQESYSLLSGKLVMKKATSKLQHDDKKLLENNKSFCEMYIKNTQSLDWSALKNDLDIKGNVITHIGTGEVLEGMVGLEMVEVAESFDIK